MVRCEGSQAGSESAASCCFGMEVLDPAQEDHEQVAQINISSFLWCSSVVGIIYGYHGMYFFQLMDYTFLVAASVF